MTTEYIENQASVYRWMNETFPGMDPDSPRKSIRALEEMVELCFASGASCNEIMDAVGKVFVKERGPDFRTDLTFDQVRAMGFPEPGKIAAEVADVDIVLDGLAGMRGFDRRAEKDKKMAINRSRRWAANGDGTGYHVKEGVTP